MISATDPVAVIALFKELDVPKRLSTVPKYANLRRMQTKWGMSAAGDEGKMKTVLLGTTGVALVGAMALPASAADWNVRFGGYLEQYVG